MKTHTTNYIDTFIEVAEDCPASNGEIPPEKGDVKTVAGLQYEILKNNPYKFTSDDVLFWVHAERNDFAENEKAVQRERFFSKGQACLRSSPLTKRYGWGIHCDSEGKVALYGVETQEYENLIKRPDLKVVKAMRTKRNKLK